MSDPSSVPPTVRRRLVAWALLRSTASVVVLVATYYVAPLDANFSASALELLAGGLLLLGLLIAWQVHAIMRTETPGLRAVEGLSVAVPLFLLIFASTYYVIARNHPGEFTQLLNRTDALYFTVTVFTTVGFGDITPRTQLARVVTTFQMIADLLVLGVLLRGVLTAVQISRKRRAAESPDDGVRRP